METNSSGEDLLLKVRKPYTITKQRERWTEDEHNRFLEALKLYGRAWQRIEEHVGTKTAVQIRSHAQKFFTKLEKEAVSKGANEIEIPIPPPRPKRKPTCPYPRKMTNSKGVSVNFPSPLSVPLSSPPSCTLNPKQKNVAGSEETLTLFKDSVPCASISSVNIKSDKKTLKEIPTQTTPPNGSQPNSDPNPKPVNQKEKVLIDEIQQDQPVQIPSPFLTNYPPFPPYLPNCHCADNSDANYKSFITAFSNMLISNLLQNPALHAAARLAASYWTPPVETEMDPPNPNSIDANPNSMDATSVAALAAATVAAASSWWASQGLLPIYPPVYYNSSNNNNVSSEVINALSENNDGKGEKEGVKEAKSDCSHENMEEEIITDVNNNKNNNNDENNNDNNGKKKHDPSSCGSNTPSSSDVETDNITENLQKGPNCDNEKTEGPFCNNNIDNRRGRTSSSYLSMNDSWKEVSEEGRLAFQALFKRGVLPQSFSPPQKKFNGEERETEERENVSAELAVDLNVNADIINPFSAFQGLDLQKLKGRRTGFKPYKRCSVENINRGTAGEETAGNKRIRLEGETAAST